VGSGYNVFWLHQTSELLLSGVVVDHVAIAPGGDQPHVGAAVHLRDRAHAVLEDCSVRSVHGLGLWTLHRPRAEVTRCRFFDTGRSGIALFGRPTVRCSDCLFEDCRAHGCCSRGESRVLLERCFFAHCGQRGVYAYQQCHMTMQDCDVRETEDPSRAAVDGGGCKAGDAVRLELVRCVVEGNKGAGVRLRGSVTLAAVGSRSFANATDLDIALGGPTPEEQVAPLVETPLGLVFGSLLLAPKIDLQLVSASPSQSH
jgi:hypothetical protein